MRFLSSLLPSLLLVGAGITEAAQSWSFNEAVISVSSKSGDGFKDKYGRIQMVCENILLIPIAAGFHQMRLSPNLYH